MRELDEKEGVFKSVHNKGEQLICKNHPARATIEVSLLCLSPLVDIRKAEDFRLQSGLCLFYGHWKNI